MHSYTVTVSFRLQHPEASLKNEFTSLSKLPGIIPGRLMDIGEQRMDIRGGNREGLYSDSKCSFGFMDEWKKSSEVELPEILDTAMDVLVPQTGLLKRVVDTGGRLEFFIGLGVDANSGMILEPDILKRLADLNIGLSFDMYPPDKASAISR